MILLLGFAFLSGLVTILAPCIWSPLPIILSTTVSGNGHMRPLGITVGVMASFMIFTLTISTIVKIFHFDPDILRVVAVVIIGFLGLTMIIPELTKRFEIAVSSLSNKFGGQKKQTEGFKGGFLTGLSLGIIWSPCAGPILASIAALAVTGQVTLNVVLVTLAYVIGVGIPLFAFAYGGQKFITKSKTISKYTGRIQQVFGVLMILTALAIFTNYDRVIQAELLNTFPQFGTTLNSFESNPQVLQQLNKLKGTSDLTHYRNAPEFTGIDTWLNSKPLTMEQLKGKVVLIDFWTYTCINCVRTLPYVTSWYEKYKDQGFVVIGVHTPEFEFEKKTSNVENAIKQFKINYPVAQDNEYGTWNAYANQYWPAEYLVDAQGIVRHEHFGEGDYDETEKAIQSLLKEIGKKADKSLTEIKEQTPISRITPETYIGLSRLGYTTNSISNTGVQNFTLTKSQPADSISFGGEWDIEQEYSSSSKNSVLQLHFNATKVFIVITPASSNDSIDVLLDGKKISSQASGVDVINGVIKLDSSRLYEIVSLDKQEEHTLQLAPSQKGIQFFAFTFG